MSSFSWTTHSLLPFKQLFRNLSLSSLPPSFPLFFSVSPRGWPGGGLLQAHFLSRCVCVPLCRRLCVHACVYREMCVCVHIYVDIICSPAPCEPHKQSLCVEARTNPLQVTHTHRQDRKALAQPAVSAHLAKLKICVACKGLLKSASCTVALNK